jgi:hypothetical protein
VNFFAKVNTNKANSSQQMDYKVWSLDLGNFPHSYYYIKKVSQVVRLVINIRVKERVYSISKNKVHIILVQQDAWYMRGVLYAILTLGNSCSVLPSLETFHSTTTEKKHSPIHGCCHTWGCVVRDKTKEMTQQNTCTTQPKQIFMVLLITKTFALFLELCASL